MATIHIGSRWLLAALAVLIATAGVGAYRGLTPASAASGGTITGQVVWCAPIPILMGVPGTAEGIAPPPSALTPTPMPADPSTKPDVTPALALPVRPVPAPRLIPAGAVLVAVQGTSLGARTSEDGRFAIEGVPTGQYLTVAVGPVAKMNGAVASRPNAFVTDGQKLDLGQLSLSQPCSYYGPVPYAVPASGAVTPEGAE